MAAVAGGGWMDLFEGRNCRAMADWVKVSEVGELAPGDKKQIDLDGIEVALFNVEGEYFCIEDICTHDGAPLCHGRLAGEEITCPRHGARFSVKTGAALCMPAVEPTETYPVKVEGNDIMIEIDL
jgi:3-phenylpropionate/trans-cinnamate dioxygenase ferredoxin subunit